MLPLGGQVSGAAEENLFPIRNRDKPRYRPTWVYFCVCISLFTPCLAIWLDNACTLVNTNIVPLLFALALSTIVDSVALYRRALRTVSKKTASNKMASLTSRFRLGPCHE